MFASEILWAIIGIGIIVLGGAMIYGMMRSRRTRDIDRPGDEGARKIYRDEQR